MITSEQAHTHKDHQHTTTITTHHKTPNRKINHKKMLERKFNHSIPAIYTFSMQFPPTIRSTFLDLLLWQLQILVCPAFSLSLSLLTREPTQLTLLKRVIFKCVNHFKCENFTLVFIYCVLFYSTHFFC